MVNGHAARAVDNSGDSYYDVRAAFDSQASMLCAVYAVKAFLPWKAYTSHLSAITTAIQFDLVKLFDEVVNEGLQNLPHRRDLPDNMVLLGVAWADGGQAQTTFNIAWIDPTGKLLPKFISRVQKLFAYDGPEQQLLYVSDLWNFVFLVVLVELSFNY
jgi:hypothetical protein